MNYFKYICLIALLVVTFNSCTEIYNPDINSDVKALVVEGLITNESGPFTIKLSEAKSFSGDLVIGSKVLSGAIITITDNEGRNFKLIESTDGNYVTPTNFTTKIGNTYKLNIITNDGNTYESNQETLLPPQAYDSIYVVRTTESYMNNSNQMENVEGADILVDLFKSQPKSELIPACRFVNKITVQYNYNLPVYDASGNVQPYTHWHYFGWRTFNLNNIENMTVEKSAKSDPFIPKHSIGFIPFPPINYGILIPIPIEPVYYLRVNQYTVNNDTYSFYNEANSQLSASGKLFDPITSQLHGNMKCVNNPSKVVLGLFEVSSVMKHAFVVKSSLSNTKISIIKASVMDMPANWELQEKVNELGGNPTRLPDWWEHK